MLRAAGVVALIVLAACSGTSGTHTSSPTPIVAQGSWTQNLTFSGEVAGHMAGIVPDVGDRRSQCTGGGTHKGGTGSGFFYGTGETDGQIWGGVFEIKKLPRPGLYPKFSLTIQSHRADATPGWPRRGNDK